MWGGELSARVLQGLSPNIRALLDRLEDDSLGDFGEYVKAYLVRETDEQAYVADIKDSFMAATGRDKVPGYEWRQLYESIRGTFGIEREGRHGRQYYRGLRLMDRAEVEASEL